MRTKLWTLAVLAGTGVLLASSPAAMAALDTYNFTFSSGGGMDATGTITIDSDTGVAQTGSINVTGVPVEASPSTLITAAGSLLPASGVENVENHNGDVVTYDNLVNFANNPILTGNGLGFGAGQYGPTHYNTLIGLNGGDIYGNLSPNLYTLFVGEAEVDANGNVLPGESEYVYYYDSGSLAFTAVPEPAAYGDCAAALTLLPFGVRMLRMLRRRQAA